MKDMHATNILHLSLDNSYRDDMCGKKNVAYVNILKVHVCITLPKGKIIAKAYEG